MSTDRTPKRWLVACLFGLFIQQQAGCLMAGIDWMWLFTYWILQVITELAINRRHKQARWSLARQGTLYCAHQMSPYSLVPSILNNKHRKYMYQFSKFAFSQFSSSWFLFFVVFLWFFFLVILGGFFGWFSNLASFMVFWIVFFLNSTLWFFLLLY